MNPIRFPRAFALALVSLASLVAQAQTPLVCDANADRFIDRLDIDLINAARNKPASGPTDPRDPDRDGRITVIDARTCTQRCGLPGCATRTNASPTVNAGAAQTVALAYGPSPSAYADLAATVTDDGLPNPPAKVTLAWSKVSGPGAVSFVAPAAAATRVFLEKAGTYVLRLAANDGAATGTGEITVNVVVPPPTTPTLRPIPDRTIALGSRLDVALAVDEPNAFDALTYSMPAAPAGARFNPPPVIEWTPTSAQLGVNTFTVGVRNASGASDTRSFRVTVIDGNRPPVLDAQADAIGFVGAPFSRVLNATDPDAGDTLFYAVLAGPAGMALGGGRTLAWTPTADQLGEHLVTVAATDSAGASAFARFAITVRAAAKPVARDDRFSVQIGGTLAIGAPGVLANDVDPNAGTLTASKRSDPDKGVLQSFGSDGSLLYRAPPALAPRPPFQPSLKWHADRSLFSYAMAIGDVDGDGRADVVHLAYNNQIRALRGSDGSILWARNGLPAPYSHCTPFLGDDNVPVIADIDDDGLADVVLHVGCNNDSPNPGFFGHTRVIALNGRDGSVKWLSPRLVIGYDPAAQGPPRTITEGVTLAVARLAPGESPSILGGHTIEDFAATNGCAHVPGGAAADKRCRYVFALDGSDGTLRRGFYSTPSDQALPAMNYDKPGLNGIGRFESPIVLDFDGDGALEVLYEGSLWSAGGTLLRQFDGGRARPNGSRAAAADLDGDGRIDIVLVDQQLGRARAYAVDGTLLWDAAAPHCAVGSGAFCAASIADVDADGQPDVLIGGRDRLVVHDRFGRVKWATVDPNRSVENRFGCDNRAAVYDLDGDGMPEVIVRDAYVVRFLRGTTGEEIAQMSFGPANSGYLCALPQEVRIADVDADGQADVVFNAPYDGISGLDFGGIWVLQSATDPWMPARNVFNGWGYVTTGVNDDLTVPATYVRPNAEAATNLFAQQRQLATRPDLRLRERTSFTYAALSQGVASDTATVDIDIVPPNRPPVITSIAPVAGPTTNFSYQLAATDPDPGDTLSWSLVYADFVAFDTAAAIDAATGLLTKSRSSPAGYLFIVRVTDSQGAFAEQAIYAQLTSATSTVPALIGQSKAAALSLLAVAKLVAGAVVEQYDGAPAGQVVGQAPGAGAVVSRGAAVLMTVSKGPAPQIVPSVVGRTLASAASVLGGSGFAVGTSDHRYSAAVPRGEIVSQSPSAGALALPGPVDVVVSGGIGLELTLSHTYTTADRPIDFAAIATAPDGSPSPLPAIAYSVAPIVTPFAGPLPTIGAGTLQFGATTRGGFRLTAVDTASGRIATADFGVGAPRVAGASAMDDLVELTGTLQGVATLIHEADAAGAAGDVATARARVIEAVALWRSLDRDALRLAAPMTLEEGFLPTPAGLASAGVAAGPDDGINKQVLRESIPLLRAWTEGLRAPATSLAQLNALADAFAAKARLLRGLRPGEFGTVDAAAEYAMIATRAIPDLIDAMMDELARTVATAPAASASATMKALSQPRAAAGSTAGPSTVRIASSLGEQLVVIAVKQIVDRIDTAKQYTQQIITQAAWGAVMVAAAQHARAFLQGQELLAVVSGASLSFRVFESPWSFVEGLGLEKDYPELNTVILIGPDLFDAAKDAVDKLKAASKYRLDPKDADGRYKSAGEIKNDLKGLQATLKDLLASGTNLVDVIENAFQSTDEPAGQCIFTTDPACVQLMYSDGFASVYHYTPPDGFASFTGLPVPIVFIVRNNVTGQLYFDTPPFLPTKE
jgi:hypothetical protein